MPALLLLNIILQMSAVVTPTPQMSTKDSMKVELDEATTSSWQESDYISSVYTEGGDDVQETLHIIYQGSVTLEQYKMVQQVTSKFLMPVVCIIGVVGNYISLLVFIKQGSELRLSTRVYLQALCLTDIIFLLLSLTQEVIEDYVNASPSLISKIVAYKNLYIRPLYMATGGLSSVLVVIISLERFFAICFPMLIKAGMLFQKYPRLLVFLASTINVTVYILIILSRNITVYFDPIHKVKMWRSSYTEFGLRGNLMKILGTTLEIFYGVVAVLFVLLFNIAIVVRLQMAARERKKMTQGNNIVSSSESQATHMLVGVAVLFLVCTLPVTVRSLLWFLHPDFGTYGREHFLSLTLLYFARLTSKINSSANIMVYVLASASFRATLKSLWVCRKCITKDLSLSEGSNSTGKVSLTGTSEGLRM